jgi:hypothetical protein
VSELGAKLGKPYNISASDNIWSYRGYGNRAGFFNVNASQNISSAASAMADYEDTFAAGQISVSANVNVSFLLK